MNVLKLEEKNNKPGVSLIDFLPLPDGVWQ